ncbi:MAG: hypothetical protein EBX50_02195 [Chitinophagia bacterium]|nr:hypothetical protein [Chitinophagia bacterium]
MNHSIFSILRIEWMKIKRYRAFWFLTGIIALTYPITILAANAIYHDATEKKGDAGALAKLLLGDPFSFPNAWHSIAYFSSFFILLPAILVIMLITNEFQFRTHRQNILDGWSRNEFMIGKCIDVFIISGWVTLIYMLVSLYFGFVNSDDSWYRVTENAHFIGLFFLQTFAQLSIAFLLGFLLKRAFMAMALLVFYYLVIENILVAYASNKLQDIGRFLPFEVSDRLIPAPGFFSRFGDDMRKAYELSLSKIPEHALYTLILTTAIWVLCFRLFSKRDL